MASAFPAGQGTPFQDSGAICQGCRQLLEEFGDAVREVLSLNEAHFLAVMNGDEDPHRFDILIHLANERKQNAKYAYVQHLESHKSPEEQHGSH